MQFIKKVSLFSTLGLLLLNACKDENPVNSQDDSEQIQADSLNLDSLGSDTLMTDTTSTVDPNFNLQDLVELENQVETFNTLFDPNSFNLDSTGVISSEDLQIEVLQSQLESQDINIPDTLIQELVTNPDFIDILETSASTQELDTAAVETFVFDNLEFFIDLIQYLPETP